MILIKLNIDWHQQKRSFSPMNLSVSLSITSAEEKEENSKFVDLSVSCWLICIVERKDQTIQPKLKEEGELDSILELELLR